MLVGTSADFGRPGALATVVGFFPHRAHPKNACDFESISDSVGEVFSLIGRFATGAGLVAWVSGLLFTCGCVIEDRVRFEMRLAVDGCAKQVAQISHYEVFLLPLDHAGQLCLLKQSTLDALQYLDGGAPPATPPALLLEAGTLDQEEIVVLVQAYAGDSSTCVRCHALARLLLQDELTRYTLTLAPTTGCAIPAAALDTLGLRQEPLPPTTPCSPP